MISEKDYNEIYLKGYEEDKKIEQIYPLNNESDEFRVLADKINEIIYKINNLKINYEVKPSFTTRKIKELQQQCKKQKEVIDRAVKYIENEMPYLQETDKEYVQDVNGNTYFTYKEYDGKELLDILKEV